MWYQLIIQSELSNKVISHVATLFYTVYSGITVCFVCSLFAVIVVQSSSLWRFTSTLYSQITLLTVPRRKKKCIRYLQRGRCASPHSSDGSAIDSPPSPVYHPPNPASPTSRPLPQSAKRSAHPPRLSLDFSRIKTESVVRQPQWPRLTLDRCGDWSHALQVLFTSVSSAKTQTSSHGASSYLLGSHGFPCGWISWRMFFFFPFSFILMTIKHIVFIINNAKKDHFCYCSLEYIFIYTHIQGLTFTLLYHDTVKQLRNITRARVLFSQISARLQMWYWFYSIQQTRILY